MKDLSSQTKMDFCPERPSGVKDLSFQPGPAASALKRVSCAPDGFAEAAGFDFPPLLSRFPELRVILV